MAEEQPVAASLADERSNADGLEVIDEHAAKESGEANEADEAAAEEARERLRREREARAQALTLEIVGDLPFAEVKPPENVLFVCKLNPVTEGQPARALVDLMPNSKQMKTLTSSSVVLAR